jgi:hypothetical protein
MIIKIQNYTSRKTTNRDLTKNIINNSALSFAIVKLI